MAPIALENEDHSRDAAFNKVMHGKSVESTSGFRALLSKDREAHKAASEEYFKHWDNKSAGSETAEIREVHTFDPANLRFLPNTITGPKSGICHTHSTLL